VIKLSVSREPISRSSSIQWGEIVAYDIKSGANQDWTHRSRGCMAIRLLNKANCVGMPDETDAFFDLGVRVAIIDLRVFVPEVILDPYAKSELIQDICALKPIRSLSGTQLEAFAAALYSSVHCTQGPPGTGKVN